LHGQRQHPAIRAFLRMQASRGDQGPGRGATSLARAGACTQRASGRRA
jgi:hypothetical protein